MRNWYSIIEVRKVRFHHNLNSYAYTTHAVYTPVRGGRDGLPNPNETVLVWLHSLSFDILFVSLHNLIDKCPITYLSESAMLYKYNQYYIMLRI